jgi:hypothetical protein
VLLMSVSVSVSWGASAGGCPHLINPPQPNARALSFRLGSLNSGQCQFWGARIAESPHFAERV